MVSKLESGEQSNPSLETIEKIATALGVEVYELMGWEAYSDNVFSSIDKELQEFKDSPVNYIHAVVREMFTSKEGTEYFQINHNAISPDEWDALEADILNYIQYQFSKYKDKPSIYEN